jgi:hypothetical protein
VDEPVQARPLKVAWMESITRRLTVMRNGLDLEIGDLFNPDHLFVTAFGCDAKIGDGVARKACDDQTHAL